MWVVVNTNTNTNFLSKIECLNMREVYRSPESMSQTVGLDFASGSGLPVGFWL